MFFRRTEPASQTDPDIVLKALEKASSKQILTEHEAQALRQFIIPNVEQIKYSSDLMQAITLMTRVFAGFGGVIGIMIAVYTLVHTQQMP